MNIGAILIFFSLGICIISLALFSISATGKKDFTKNAKRLFYASGLSLTIAVILLFVAFLTDRYDFSYVYSYSSSDLHILYKFAGFWAGQEGTFLLWVYLLFIFGVIVIRSRDKDENILLAVIVITKIFFLFILCIHSPFKYIWDAFPQNFSPGIMPPDGSGLNPLLQDPWMIIHPPVLFLGYASASIPFAYAIAALIRNDYSSWGVKSYKWVLFCVTTLGIGIFLGAYWAYDVLGWGGYWGWDPVENSSLIPWFTVLALMHGLIIQNKKNALVKTNLFMTIITLVLIFYGTFLTRSGILSDFSVHSFGDLGLTGYLLFFILFFLLSGVSLLVYRFKGIETESLDDNILSFNNIISYGIICLIVYDLLILIGTSMPIISNFIMPNATSVTAKYYNNISVPFGTLLITIIIFATIFQFPKKIDKRNIILMTIFSIITGVLLNMFNTNNIIAYIFVILGVFIIIQNIIDLYKYKSFKIKSSRLAHLGIGVMVIGIITSNIHSHSIQKSLVKNTETKIKSVSLTFKGMKRAEKSSLQFLLKEGNSEKNIETLYYINKKTNSLYREPYISYGFFNDVYISPLDFKAGAENAGKLVMNKGEEKIIEDLKIKFIGWEIGKEHMETKKPKLFVKLIVKINNKKHIINPGIIIRGNKNRKSIDAIIPGTKRKISLMDFDIGNKKILLNVEPGKNKNIIMPPDTAIMEVSFKRLIWLVWLGTIFISVGGFVALKRKSGTENKA